MKESLEQLSEDAAKCAGAPVWPLSDEDLVDCLDAAHRLEQAAAAVKAHLVRQIEIRGFAGFRDRRGIGSWLRGRLRIDPRAARDLIRVARAIDRYEHLDQAYSAGDISTRQVLAIGNVLDEFPAGADVEHAQTALVEQAYRSEPAQLRRFGTHILDRAGRPDRVDADENEALRVRGFTLSMPFEGSVRLSGFLPIEDAATVRAALEPLSVPRRGDGRTPAQRRADALVDVCRLGSSCSDLPDNGGERPQRAVPLSSDEITQGLRRAHLDTDEAPSTTAARRLAYGAQILPVVLAGAAQVIDVGRARRVAAGALRVALVRAHEIQGSARRRRRSRELGREVLGVARGLPKFRYSGHARRRAIRDRLLSVAAPGLVQ